MRTCQVNKALNRNYKTFRTTPLTQIMSVAKRMQSTAYWFQRSNEKLLNNITVDSVVFLPLWTTCFFGVITPTSIKAFASVMVSPESRSRNSTRSSMVVADP